MSVATGRFDLAAEQFGKLVELTPADSQAHYGLALSLFQSRSFSGAAAALETGVARFPDDLALSHLLARLLATVPDAALRDGQRALALAQRVIERQLTLDHAETLAMALAEVGRFEEAASWQQRVLDEASSNRAAAGQGGASQQVVSWDQLQQMQSRLERYKTGRAVRASPR